MASKQDERDSSEGHPSCTLPDKDTLMEYDMVEPLDCDMSAVEEIFSKQSQNISSDVVVDGEKSNKALQLSDVNEVGSEEIELGDEVLESSLILCIHNVHV
ncbi:hypothetical protein AHAS_Ahas04G0138700 [Arachis hypogaea]